MRARGRFPRHSPAFGARKVAIVLGVVVVCAARPSWAICRVVAEKGTLPPIVEPAQPVLLVLEHDVPVGPGCPPPQMQPPPMMMMPPAVEDLGVAGEDAGEELSDGGSEAGVDAWFDAMLDDSGSNDAGETFDAGDDAGPSAPPDFAAMPDLSTPCSQRRGNAVTMVVQPRFSSRDASGARFALLMVTPTVPTVSLAEPTLFAGLDRATARQIIHKETLVEDEALGYQCNDPKWNSGGCGGGGSWTSGGGGTVPDYTPPRIITDSDGGLPAAASTLGPYDVAVLSADLARVTAWLDENGFYYERGDLDALRPYVTQGWSVVAIRVRFSLLREKTALAPVAFTYESSTLRLPIAVGRSAAGGKEPLTVFIAAEAKYLFPGSTLKYAWQATVAPRTSYLTRADLTVDTRLTMERDPVATLHSGMDNFRETIEVVDTVKIPSSRCPQGSTQNGSIGCFCGIGGRGAFGGAWLFFAVLATLALRRVGALRAARRDR